MAYREVTMVEIKEVLRQWLAGGKKKRIAKQLGLDPKTVRRYVKIAEGCGITADSGPDALTAEVVSAVTSKLRSPGPRDTGEAWNKCAEHRERIKKLLEGKVRLTKVRRLLRRSGVRVPYSTLHRYATAELGFGRRSPTVPIVDGKPGEELQVDTGWMTLLEPGDNGKRRRFRAWIFTPAVSRFRFVYPCFKETTETAIEACEAAWEFYGGVFSVLIPDNTKAIVQTADPLEPLINETFLEYAQSRGFNIDTTRARKPKDKARVERTVRDVRDDCYAGETLYTIDDAHTRGLYWSKNEYGMRRHSTTLRLPYEHFEAEEKEHLLAPPSEPYDIPTWCKPKVGRDHYAHVNCALYSLPNRYIGRRLKTRADKNLVRFYDKGEVIRVWPTQPRGGKCTNPDDFPKEKTVYAMRDIVFLQKQASGHGPQIGKYAAALLDSPLPWTRMRRVYALLGLVKRYGAERAEKSCEVALAADLVSVHRLERILKLAAPPPTQSPPEHDNVLPLGRYLRPAETYALPYQREAQTEGEEAS